MSRVVESIFERYPALSAHMLGDAPDAALGGEVDVRREGGFGVLRMRNATGSGEMRFCEAFPGAVVSYNDFRLEHCRSGFLTSEDVLCVDYCLEGRIEQPMPGGTYTYVSSGDLKLDDRSNHTGLFELPARRYRGVMVSFELPRAQASLDAVPGGFPVSLRELKARFCRGGRPFILHGCASFARLFADIDAAPPEVRPALCKVKALELLLLLRMLDADGGGSEPPYFSRASVEKVKAARRLMVADLSASPTVEAAAEAVGMPLTAFKACFKGVYGASPAAHVRQVRMEHAAALLRETGWRVADIGVEVGYDSPSKFSAAFKAAMGETPVAYRRSHVG